jgi:hypothetical protein
MCLAIPRASLPHLSSYRQATPILTMPFRCPPHHVPPYRTAPAPCRSLPHHITYRQTSPCRTLPFAALHLPSMYRLALSCQAASLRAAPNHVPPNPDQSRPVPAFPSSTCTAVPIPTLPGLSGVGPALPRTAIICRAPPCTSKPCLVPPCLATPYLVSPYHCALVVPSLPSQAQFRSTRRAM